MLAIMAALNASVAYDYLRGGNVGLAITFASYAVACVGFIVANLKA